MATQIMLKHSVSGVTRKGFYGFSWTTLFFGGYPALFRGDLMTAVAIFVATTITLGGAQIIWAFFYNKNYTVGLLEKGYALNDSDSENLLVKKALGVY